MLEALIVSADDEWRIGLRDLLVRGGKRVHEASSEAGQRAVLARVTPDLVVLAHEVVSASKLPWLPELRARAPHASVVLLVGASLSASEEAQLRRENGVLLVRSPVGPEQIETVLSGLIPPPSDVRVSASRVGASADAPPSVNQQLERLQRAYRSRLTERLDELGRALLAARDRGPGSPEFRNAQHLCHKLRGSAGSFGFPLVTACAAEIDDQLGLLDKGRGDASPWAAIEQALTRAGTELDPVAACVRPGRSLCSGLHVLVLDDDPDCRQLVSLLGRAASLNVIEAASTADALRVVAREPIDVALVDLHLGQMDDGLVAMARLRQSRPSSLPIVAFSADTSVENRLAAVRAGADAFLAKPVNADELALTVRRLGEVERDEPHRILVVDDDPTSAASIARLLTQQGWHASTLHSTENIFETLDRVRPELLLLDVMMPVNGLDICRVVRASPAWRELAIVFVTGSTDPDTLIHCYEAGGDDCISKPVAPRELSARLKLRLARARVFRQLAHEDTLTGLLTREAFSAAAARRVAEATRHGRPLSIVMLDLDRFKYVNDQHGHLAGDRVLRAFGNLLKQRFRVEDFRGRWGGEEFVMALSDTTAESTTQAVERALDEFRALCFEGDSEELFCCSFSAGIAQLPDDGVSLNALMQCADLRLYAAKAAGRSRVMSNPPPALSLRPTYDPQLLSRISGTFPSAGRALIAVKSKLAE
jgi:diguanylate cyclase (GGDEF)-like protein